MFLLVYNVYWYYRTEIVLWDIFNSVLIAVRLVIKKYDDSDKIEKLTIVRNL